jgi:outer membrane receptor protein involved in Fe transport
VELAGVVSIDLVPRRRARHATEKDMNNRIKPAATHLSQFTQRPLAAAFALACAWPVHAQGDLTSLSIEQLMQVSVSGASKYEQRQDEIAAAVSVITRNEIRQFGWRTIDDALASLPGLSITYDRQYSYLGARGFGLPGDYTSRVLVMINGNRLNDPLYDSAPTGRSVPLDIDLIERIEFIPGPGGAVYGQNAMFGVINLVTRSAMEVGAEAAAAYEHPQATREGRASWGGRLGESTELLLSASAMRSRGEDRFYDYGAAGVSGVASGLDRERDAEFFASLRSGRWDFDFVYSDRRKDDPTGAYLSDPLVAGQYQVDRYLVSQLQYRQDLGGDHLRLVTRLFGGEQTYRGFLSYGSPYEFPTDAQWLGAEARLLYTGIAGHTLLFGVEGQDNRREDQYVNDLADPANNFAIERSGYRHGLFAQDDWRISQALSATVGLRVDRNNKTKTKFSPRAALIWRSTPSTTLRALYGRAHRAPNTYERDFGDGLSQVANPALGGESIETWALVADHRVGRDLTLRLSAYRWTLDDIITLGIDPISGIPQYQSGAPVRATGGELSVDRTWAGGARMRGSLSLQDVQQSDGKRLPNSARTLLKLNASMPLPWAGLRVAYALQYTSARLTLDGSDLGGYALSDLVVAADGWLPGLALTLGLHNLFDKRHEHPGADTNWQNALEQDGRSVRLKAVYRF